MSSKLAFKPNLLVLSCFSRVLHRILVVRQATLTFVYALCRRWHGACPPSHDLFPEKKYYVSGKMASLRQSESLAFTMPFDTFGEQRVCVGYGKGQELLCEQKCVAGLPRAYSSQGHWRPLFYGIHSHI